MPQSVQIEFKLLFGDQWVSVDTFLSHSVRLLDHYIGIPGLHCCDFQGGLFIHVDGQVWSDDGMEDIHHSGHIAMPRVQVSLADFGGQVAVESRKFARLIEELRTAIAGRRADGEDDEVDAQLRIVESNCPADVAALVDELVSRLRSRA